MTNTKSEGLIDRLQALTNAKYLSDLCFMDYESIRTQLPRLNDGEYTLIQRLDASEYLTGIKPDLDTQKKCMNICLISRNIVIQIVNKLYTVVKNY